jgi:asparagine synthase (glutamine-hydrolysing)
VCGIVGSFNPLGESAAPGVVERMRDCMTHRGPDGAGLWQSPDRHCTLGHRRLSIIDLSAAAAQPMLNAAGSVAVTFNGEIYNHHVIRAELEKLGKYVWTTDHSDTEVLLHAYEEWGLECVHRFYGMFAFAVYDARDRARPLTHLVRDRVGIKPMYFARTPAGEWLFASEIKALLAHPSLSPEMDRAAFWHYLTFIVTPAPMTLFRGIFKLPAGHWLTIDHTGAARATAYWDCAPRREDTWRESDLSEDEAADQLLALLRTSIARRMVSDVPFGVLLSGGVDSSLNVALMAELMDRPVSTFTVGYEGKADYNEFEHARRVSRRFGTDHHETAITRAEMQAFLPALVRVQDEPIADNVCIPLYFLAQLVKRNGTTVVQVGEGADENFLGYWWCEHYRQKDESVYQPARDAATAWWKRPFSRRASILATAEDRDIACRAKMGQQLFWGGATCWWGAMRQRLTPDAAPFRTAVDCPVPDLLPESYTHADSHAVVARYLAPLDGRLDAPEILQKIPYMEMKLRLPEHLLMRVDKLTMAHAVEARVPFLDHDVVDFARRLPSRYKLRDGVGKRVVKQVASRYIDDDLVYRRKQGFGAPMEEWFREGDFGARCLRAFERSAIRREGLLDNEYFTSLLKDQIAGRGGYSFQLWTVMNAVLWHASWIEGIEDCL